MVAKETVPIIVEGGLDSEEVLKAVEETFATPDTTRAFLRHMWENNPQKALKLGLCKPEEFTDEMFYEGKNQPGLS